MDLKPFQRLAVPRSIEQGDWPTDLAKFFAANEGVGLESQPDRSIRLCRLEEVTRIGCQDLQAFSGDELPGWEKLDGFRVGVGMFFEEIVLVLDCPCCPPGSIVAFGFDVAGPGGTGPYTDEGSLVLATSFGEWIDRLERTDWEELGLVPGRLSELPEGEAQEHRTHYHQLNPQISWGPANL